VQRFMPRLIAFWIGWSIIYFFLAPFAGIPSDCFQALVAGFIFTVLSAIAGVIFIFFRFLLGKD
jgi:hypothetical protein